MVNPEEVTSPKSRLQGPIKVLARGGAGKFSIARFTWDNEPAVGIRWNGEADKGSGPRDVGNPQSRGLPSWFILPKVVAELVEKNLDDINASLGSSEGGEPPRVPASELEARLERVERLLEQLLNQQAGA